MVRTDLSRVVAKEELEDDDDNDSEMNEKSQLATTRVTCSGAKKGQDQNSLADSSNPSQSHNYNL